MLLIPGCSWTDCVLARLQDYALPPAYHKGRPEGGRTCAPSRGWQVPDDCLPATRPSAVSTFPALWGRRSRDCRP